MLYEVEVTYVIPVEADNDEAACEAVHAMETSGELGKRIAEGSHEPLDIDSAYEIEQ